MIKYSTIKSVVLTHLHPTDITRKYIFKIMNKVTETSIFYATYILYFETFYYVNYYKFTLILLQSNLSKSNVYKWEYLYDSKKMTIPFPSEPKTSTSCINYILISQSYFSYFSNQNFVQFTSMARISKLKASTSRFSPPLTSTSRIFPPLKLY